MYEDMPSTVKNANQGNPSNNWFLFYLNKCTILGGRMYEDMPSTVKEENQGNPSNNFFCHTKCTILSARRTVYGFIAVSKLNFICIGNYTLEIMQMKV